IILFTAEVPVFQVASVRKAWATAVVIAAGKTIRDRGGFLLGIDYVGLTDSELVKSGKIVRFPASFAERLQAAIHDGKIDVAIEDLDKRLRLEGAQRLCPPPSSYIFPPCLTASPRPPPCRPRGCRTSSRPAGGAILGQLSRDHTSALARPGRARLGD